jgi:hypothetical protein
MYMKMLVAKEEFEASGYEYSAGMLAVLFDVTVCFGNIDEADVSNFGTFLISSCTEYQNSAIICPSFRHPVFYYQCGGQCDVSFAWHWLWAMIPCAFVGRY